MEKIIKDTLILLGLSSKEIRFMLACFQIGDATMSDIIKKTKLERSTAYLLSDNLLEKGFITVSPSRYRQLYSPVQPKTLLRMLSYKQRVIRRKEMELEDRLSELQTYYNTARIRPNSHMFQGKNALTAVWEDVLSTNKEILLWTNQKTESTFFTEEFHEKFIKERIKKRIPIRALVVNNTPGRKLLEKDALSLRHSKLIPLQMTFSAETYIYDNKVAVLDYKKDIFAVIIESESVASVQRAIFELTWRSTE